MTKSQISKIERVACTSLNVWISHRDLRVQILTRAWNCNADERNQCFSFLLIHGLLHRPTNLIMSMDYCTSPCYQWHNINSISLINIGFFFILNFLHSNKHILTKAKKKCEILIRSSIIGISTINFPPTKVSH